jgi:putative transposase
MAHSFVSNYYHCVFSTKERRKLITPELEERLWPFLGGIARTHKMKALAIGGVEDHVHLLLSLPSTLAIAKAIQFIKGESSKWVHDTFAEHQKFAWQEGYGAFSIGISQYDVKWTPKTGQSNKLLLAVQERGNHGEETEVPHGDVQGSGGAGSGEG